jgi:hypothetical protein
MNAKIILEGDIFYGYAQDTALTWLREYEQKGYKGLCAFWSERHNLQGSIFRLKSGTYKIHITKIA